MDGLVRWVESITPKLVVVAKLLIQNLPDEPEALIHELTAIEAWYGRTGYYLAEANSWLDQATYIHMPEKKAQVTELDRKTQVEHEVADIRAWRNKIESIHDAIKTRITLGQSLLAYRRQSIENNKVMRTAQPW